MRRLIDRIAFFALLLIVGLRPLIAESYDSAGQTTTRALSGISDPSPIRTIIFDLVILGSALVALVRPRTADTQLKNGSPDRVGPDHVGPNHVGPDHVGPDHVGPVFNRSGDGLETRPTLFQRAANSFSTWSAVGWVSFALASAAAIYSSLHAGNQRIALNGAIDLLCLPAITFALVVLTSTSISRRIALFGIIVASATAQSTNCLEQYYVTFEDTWRHYQEIKTEFWASQGVDLNSEKVALFENRIRAREASGSLPHSNVTGSYLMLAAFVTAGGAMHRLFRRSTRKPNQQFKNPLSQSRANPAPHEWGPIVISASLTALLVWATLLTGSRGAILSSVMAVFCLVTYHFFRRALTDQKWLTLACWLGLLGILGLACIQLLQRLPAVASSLVFRWQYWKASALLIRDHLPWGVGRENFGRHYLAYKAIESPEEVSTPHNLFVQLTSELGLVGLLAFTALCLLAMRLCFVQSKPAHPSLVTEQVLKPKEIATFRPVVFIGIAIGMALLLIRTQLLGADQTEFVYYTTVTTAIPWLIGFFAGTWPIYHLSRRSELPAICVWILLGVMSFLIHDQINFAMFVPGSATTFFACLAFLCMKWPNVNSVNHDRDSEPRANEDAGATSGTTRRSIRTEQSRDRAFQSNDRAFQSRDREGAVISPSKDQSCSSTGRIPQTGLPPCLAIIGVIAAWLLIAWWIAAPVGLAAYHLITATNIAESELPWGVKHELVLEHLRRAEAYDRFDPTPAARTAEWWAAQAVLPEHGITAYRTALSAVDRAIARDPHHLKLHRFRMQLLLAIAEQTRVPADFDSAHEAGEKCLRLYPYDPAGFVALADAQRLAYRTTQTRGYADRAVRNYATALSLDEKRWSGEVIRRFSDEQKRKIQEHIRELSTAPRK